jgi:phosphoenolpyruvate carboxykinase (GTP)
MATLAKNTIFTNVGLTPEGGVRWEGMTDTPLAECLDWQGNKWTPEDRQANRGKGGPPQRALHGPASQCPTIDPAREDPSAGGGVVST